MKGRLEKVKINEGHSSMLRPGKVQHGKLFRLVGYFTKKPTEQLDQVAVNNLNEIQPGDMIFVHGGHMHDYIKTSPIKEIIDITENRIDFVTDTSTYAFIVEKKENNKIDRQVMHVA